jgi:ATP-dependent Lon protease
MASNAINPADFQAIPNAVGILPRRNEPDLDDLPPPVRQEMTIRLVDRLAETFGLTLLPDSAEAGGINTS